MREYYDDKIHDKVFFASEIIYAKEVKALDDYKLAILFSNGERKIYNVLPLLSKKIFAPLKNKALFNTARIENGTVVWNDDLDLCPEDLYVSAVSAG